MCETLAANNWPARSLTQLHADKLASNIDAFVPYKPSTEDLHYRTPIFYRQMLSIISSHLNETTIIDQLKTCLVFSVVIDGSVDRQMYDNKFVTCRIIDLSPTPQVRNIFLKVDQVEHGGAQGLLQATMDALHGINTSKLVGITTDGEAANTGKNGGLWKLLSDKLNMKVLTMGCVVHRSDLAVEQIINGVSELKMWKVNLKSVATYFRTSAKCTKKLHAVKENAKAFPAYFDVRFAEHLNTLIQAVMWIIPGCHIMWNEALSGKNDEDKREKAEARGFLKIWAKGSLQLWLTSLMGDVTSVFQTLQKQLQAGDLIMPDVITCRDMALRKLKIMKSGPYPGGIETKFFADPHNANDLYSNNEHIEQKRLAASHHSLVQSNRSNFQSIRVEVIASASNFLSERLCMEQERIIKYMKGILEAKTCQSMISAGASLVEDLYPEEMNNFADCVCECWDFIAELPSLPMNTDCGCILSTRLRQLLPVTKGILQKILAAMMSLAPHSMQVERVISHYNNFRSFDRLSTNLDTVNHRLIICLNGCGTAYFDPRPCVAKFLSTERRLGMPDPETYEKRFYVQKFFRETNGF